MGRGLVDWISGAYILYTFDLGPCDYIAYLKKKERERRGREEERRRNERRTREERKEEEREKERKEKMEGGKHPSHSFALAFSPRRHTAASDTMAPEAAAPWA